MYNGSNDGKDSTKGYLTKPMVEFIKDFYSPLPVSFLFNPENF